MKNFIELRGDIDVIVYIFRNWYIRVFFDEENLFRKVDQQERQDFFFLVMKEFVLYNCFLGFLRKLSRVRIVVQ